MTEHVTNPHTPEEMRRFSNIGHIVEGAVVTLAAAASAIAAMADNEPRARSADRLLISGGGLLGLGLVAASVEHGGPRAFFAADVQQRQHLQMASLLCVAGATKRHGLVGRLTSSCATGAIGWMFLTHEQHGTDEAARIARERHRLLGGTIVAAAGMDALGGVLRKRALGIAAAAGLLAAGLQLGSYREPPEAYEEQSGVHGR